MPDPAKVYDGKPCKNCGATLKWKSNQSCVSCNTKLSRDWKRQAYATNPEWVERTRAAQRHANLPKARLERKLAADRRGNLTPARAEKKRAADRERFTRLYWYDGNDPELRLRSFMFRAEKNLRQRRAKALNRMAKRNEGRSNGPV